ncbi:competence protein F DNA transformation protein comF [human gut metagenome]|uniref:Competence protein F DNA transformation protein comF n=1 Tax=human gut metagenome TaxID=408170 RepID=W1WK88_9ZZZZ
MFYNTRFNDMNNFTYMFNYNRYWLDKELKRKNFDMDYDSKSILKLECKDENSIEYFYDIIDSTLKYGVTICNVPSHSPESSGTGINLLAKKLANNKRIDATECILRTKEIEKISINRSLTVKEQIETLEVTNTQLIRNKYILLIDDIIKTGNSMKACKKLLIQNGAKNVKCFALGFVK